MYKWILITYCSVWYNRRWAWLHDGKRNNKHYVECLTRQISTCAHLQNSAVWRNRSLPLIVSLHYALTYLKSLSDNIDTYVLAMPNIYWDLWHQPIWTYTPLCTNCIRITYNTLYYQVLSMYAHIMFMNVWVYFLYPMCCWVVMSSILALNFKLLIKSDLLLICCIFIHNSNICLMQNRPVNY